VYPNRREVEKCDARDFMIGTGAAGMVLASKVGDRGSFADDAGAQRVKPLVIHPQREPIQERGKRDCVQKAFAMLTHGEDVLDAVIAGVI